MSQEFESEIFRKAVRLGPDERTAYLQNACGENQVLRKDIESLLRAHDIDDRFLESPACVATIFQPLFEQVGTTIGPYKLLQQIGEGGFGIVYMAEQKEPVHRKVALKIIKPGMDTREVIARFEAERQALALMDHTSIAKVHDAGATESGRPYFVMELVRGIPITEYCDQQKLSTEDRLKLFVEVCRAVQHAHQKGIIHRDLKPANVLVTLDDDRPIPKVIDFGVAKALGQQLTEKTLFTAYGQMVGTPLYMAPEQASLNMRGVDTRSDIYSLGVLLYELLTGTTPFDRDALQKFGFVEIRRLICEVEPPRPSARINTLKADLLTTVSDRRLIDPRKLSRSLSGELDWIVMKALEKDRNRRYETATGFAGDVERFLNDEPVQACPPSAWYRVRKFARRNKSALATATVVLLAVFVALAALATSIVQIAHEQSLTATAKDDLEQTLKRERRDAYFHRIRLAHSDLSTDNLRRALKLLEECPEDLREWEWHYLMRLCRVEPIVLEGHAEINALAFSPKGDRLAFAGGDGDIKICNGSGNVVQTIAKAHTGTVVSVAFVPGGQYLASVGADRRVKVWDLTTERELFNETCDATRKIGAAYTVAFSRDGRKLAAGSNGAVRIWDWKNRELLHTLPGHGILPIPVAFRPDGRLLATGTALDGVKLWDPETGRLLRTIPAHRHPISALAFRPDGKRLASACFDSTVKLSDPETGEIFHTLDLHTGNVECVAFSPDGSRLASAGEDKIVRIWDAKTGGEVLGLRGHTSRCGCVAFSPDGQRLASASSDGTIRFWDAIPLKGDEGQAALTFAEHDDEIRRAAFSPDGQRIASAGSDGVVRVWNARNGRVSVTYNDHNLVVFCLAWHPDGDLIASAGFDGVLHTVKLWDAETGREVLPIQTSQEKIDSPYTSLAFTADGRYLVTGKFDGKVQVWDAKTGREVQLLGSHKGDVRGLALSAQGGHLASASSDGVVRLWDAANLDKKQDGRLLTDRARIPGPSVNIAFSPDGRRLATGGEENLVHLWDVEEGKVLRTLRGHTGEVYVVAFSPDGRWVASAGGDSTLRIWDSHSGRLEHTFRGHTGLISSLAFSPDGCRLVSGSRDTTVKLWNVSNLGDPEASDQQAE